MSERPEPLCETEKSTPAASAVSATSTFGRSGRPEILLPGASLSLGFSLLLLEPHPLIHPILSYGILLCITAALFLYGRKVSALLAGAIGTTTEAKVSAPEEAIAPTIDTAAFEALEKSLGLAKLLEILRSYLQNAEHLIATLDAMTEDEQWPEAVRIAQDIAGAASGFGLAALTSAARSFAQHARDGRESEELRNAAQLIVSEHQRVCSELAKLSSRLAA